MSIEIKLKVRAIILMTVYKSPMGVDNRRQLLGIFDFR